MIRLTEREWRWALTGAAIGAVIGALLFAPGCASEPREFWTRSRIVPIEFAAPLDVEGKDGRLRDCPLAGVASIDTLVDAAVAEFHRATGRALPPGSVRIVGENEEVVEPGDRELAFIFRVGRPRLRWVGDDYCATIRVGEVSACPRGDVSFPIYFRRWLLAYLQAVGQQEVARR